MTPHQYSPHGLTGSKINHIVRVHKARDSGGVNTDVVRHWKEDELNGILQRYRPSEIYNADETGLFWKLLPDNSLGFSEKTYHMTKQPKTRITVLVGANMDGSDKLPLFVIGKSKRPRVFKNVTVPVEYTTNEKAWMTRALFEDWIKKLDGRMRLEGRHIALLVDNCPAHPFIGMSNVELIFLPPNTTSVTQPIDASIIENLKFHYRFILANRRLETADNDKPPSWGI